MTKKEKRSIELVLKAEKEGVKGHKSFEVPGKYALGYKLARRMKSQLRRFFIEHAHGTAEQSRIEFNNLFIVDWENPYRLEW